MTQTATQSAMQTMHHRVAIIGTGFAGLGAAIRLRLEGIDDIILFERADDVGGTWRDNSYPGCQCDVPSHLYSFSFAPKPDWSRSFAPQAEIYQYLRETAEAFGIVPFIRFGHEVLDASWDAEEQRWRIETAGGPYTADLLISGHGPLSEPAYPDVEGLDTFAGTTFHSATWDHDHDLTGERVAVIGTGASAIQFVPEIQPHVAQLSVFQRSAPWVIPRPDRAIKPATQRRLAEHPLLQKLARNAIYWTRELAVLGLAKRPDLMRVPEKLALDHLRRQVPDAALRAQLTPHYSIGCKRILLSNEYYPALMRSNVQVVTESIREVRPHSIVTADGTEHEVDTIIFGTGFSVTDHPIGRRIKGIGGQTLAEAWVKGAEAYLGTTVAGFPNLFLMVGPNTGLGHSSMVFMMESQYPYIVDAIRTMDREGLASVDVRPEAQAFYNQDLARDLDRTVWNTGCSSWYVDENGRNTSLWPTFTWTYRRRTRTFDREVYTTRRRARRGAAVDA